MHINVNEIKSKYEKGTMVELIEMKGEPQMEPGLKGQIVYVDDIGQIHVKWENGSSLALHIEEDRFKIIDDIIKVLSIVPGKKPEVKEMDRGLQAMQSFVGGSIEMIMPFDDDAALICNEEGKIEQLALNRAMYGIKSVSYAELCSIFRAHEKNNPKTHLIGWIRFKESSFKQPYSAVERTYMVTSNNKAYMPNMSGYSIYASSVDGSDKGVRLEQYMKDEKGGDDGWEVEQCFINLSDTPFDIIAGNLLICRAPDDSDSFESLTNEQIEKYMALFYSPEQFYWDGMNIAVKKEI